MATKKPAAKKKAVTAPQASGERAAPPGWTTIGSLAFRDGLELAGSGGGQGAAACWNPDGSLAWTTELPASGPELAIDVGVGPATVFAYARENRTAWILDRTSGAILARHDVPQEHGMWVRQMRMSPAGTHVAVRVQMHAQLFTLPGFALGPKLENYANEEPIAFSDDGRYVAYTGHEIHVYEVAGATPIATWRPPDSPYELCFTPNGRLVTADGACGVCVFERDGTLVAQCDAMPERKKKQAIVKLTATDQQIAVARKDGEVIVFDHVRERFERLGRLDPSALAFAPDGQLWVARANIAMYRV